MTDSTRWFLFAGGIIALTLIYFLLPILAPFFIALLFAYMGDPLVDRLETKMSRGISVLIVFSVLSGVIISLFFILLPLIENQLSKFVNAIPRYLDWIQNSILPWLAANIGVTDVDLGFAEIKTSIQAHWTKASGVATGIIGTVSQSGMAIVGWLANLVLIPVLTFYLLRDWDILVARIRVLIPRQYEVKVVQLATESDSVLSAFLRGQLLVMLALGIVYSTGLWMIGLDFSLLIGILAGVVSFVPYLGFVVGAGVASIAALVQFQDLFHLLPVIAVFGFAQLLESFLLTPYLVGDRIGLHPVIVIFAVLAGGQLFGFMGILLALPVAAVAMVMVRHAHERYVESHLYSGGMK